MPDTSPAAGAYAPADRVLREVARSLADLRFGSVEILVHDGHVVSIERRERIRLAPTSRNGHDAH